MTHVHFLETQMSKLFADDQCFSKQVPGGPKQVCTLQKYEQKKDDPFYTTMSKSKTMYSNNEDTQYFHKQHRTLKITSVQLQAPYRYLR